MFGITKPSIETFLLSKGRARHRDNDAEGSKGHRPPISLEIFLYGAAGSGGISGQVAAFITDHVGKKETPM